MELSDEEELEVRYVSDDWEDMDEVEEFVKLPEKLLELEINGAANLLAFSAFSTQSIIDLLVVELELTRSDEKLVGIERVDVGAEVVLKLESKDCDESAERPVTCDESAVVDVGVKLEVMDASESEVVVARIPPVEFARTVSIANVLPVESTSISCTYETVAATTVTTEFSTTTVVA